MLPAIMRFDDRFFYDIIDKRKPHVCNRCCAIKSTLRLHLLYNMLERFFFILVKCQCLHDARIPFNQLRRSKSNRYAGTIDMILDKMHHCMDCTMYRTATIALATEILP